MRLNSRVLRRVRLTAVALGSSFALAMPAVVLTGAPAAATPGSDDYPTNLKNATQDSKVDPWRFYNRECTSFVAWRLNNDNHVSFSNHYLGPHWGDAAIWKAAAIDSKVRVDDVPVVGAVAWWGRGSAGSSVGHVAWVLKVNSTSSITVEEYNYLHRGFYDTRTISTTAAAWPEGFIHVSDLALSNTRVPLVSGTPKVGTTLTGYAGYWTPSGAAFAFQWYADGVAISGATAKTFSLTPAQLGKTIQFKVSATKSGIKGATAKSAATTAVAPGTFATTVPPTIAGTAQVGEPLTASPGTWSPAGSFAYQWYADGAAIKSATKTTYTPTAAQVHEPISVRVTASTTGYTTKAVTSAATADVAPGHIQQLKAPTVKGTAQVDHQLGVVTGSWSPAGKVAYQWLLDGSPVTDATKTTYTPTAAQVGKQVAVRATVTQTGYDPLTVVVPASSTVAPGTFTKRSDPAVSGSARVGSTLHATAGSWSPAGKVAFQWLADGNPIPGASGTAFKLTKAQVGKKVAVREVVTRAGYTAGSADSHATASVMDLARFSAKPRVTGSPKVGATLRASAGGFVPATATPTYQWFRGDKAIHGATGATYRPATADIGHKLSVQARLAPSGWVPTTAHSAATAPIRAVPKIGVHTTRHHKDIRMRVAVSAAGVGPAGGTVVVREGKKVLKRLHLVDGRNTGTFHLTRRGVHHLTVTYAGGKKIAPLTRNWSVRIP